MFCKSYILWFKHKIDQKLIFLILSSPLFTESKSLRMYEGFSVLT